MKRLLPGRVLLRKRTPVLSESSRAPFVCASCLFSRRQYATTSALGPPPASGYAQLSSRRLLSVYGADAAKFLQGLITASMYKGSPSGSHTDARQDPFYAGFLTGQGRVLHDLFVYPNRHHFGIPPSSEQQLGPGQAFLLEVDAAQATQLEKGLKRYKLRSAVQISQLPQDECAVWALWGDGTSRSAVPENGPRSYATEDTRAPGLGSRVVTEGGREPQVSMDRSDEDAYRIRRYLMGVPEGQEEIVKDSALPLEANMDLMGAIDFRKGCYVGQELTIRTRHRGVVRKRILPCMVYGEDETAPEKLEYKPVQEGAVSAADVAPKTSIGRVGKKGRSAGNWLAGVGNVGLALCRLQNMTDIELPGEAAGASLFDPSHEFLMQLGGGEEGNEGAKLKVKAFVPDWMRQKLAAGDVHSRQAE